MKSYQCQHCWIEVEKIPPPPKESKTWGKGELAKYRHKYARDPKTNHPNCGKRLTRADVVTRSTE